MDYLKWIINLFGGEQEEVPSKEGGEGWKEHISTYTPEPNNITEKNIVPFAFKDIYNRDTFNLKQHKDYNPLLDSLIDKIQTNTIIGEKYNDTSYADENRPGFMNFVRGAESGGGDWLKGIDDLYGKVSEKNPESTAKGSYQFTDATVETTKNRAVNLGFDEDYFKAIDSDPRKWTKEQGDVMFLVKMFAAEDTDEPLNKAFSGDKESWLELFNDIHHTKPDLATKFRANWVKDLYK